MDTDQHEIADFEDVTSARRSHPHYMGYARFEDWLEVVDPGKPVYATRLMSLRSRSDQGGPEYHDLSVLVAQLDEQGDVQYWRMRAATVCVLYGEAFDGEAALKRQAQSDLWNFVQRVLRNKGVCLRQACIAFPEGYRFFEGDSRQVRWDPAGTRFRFDEDPTVPAEPEPAHVRTAA